MTATRADVCVLACAEAWRGDGEVIASPMGTVPAIAARLARATFEPDLLLSDGEATLVAGTWAVGDAAPGPAEATYPYRRVFDLLWGGRRHVMMGPSQIDRFGNVNISAIGDHRRPTRQLLGVRGAPGNTINHATSYWIPRHRKLAFVQRVDMISGVGYDNAAKLGPGGRFVDLRRVVTDLAVLDFATADHAMRLVSVHPGVDVQDVLDATDFELVVAGDVPVTPQPDDRQLQWIREVIDPRGLREREVPNV